MKNKAFIGWKFTDSCEKTSANDDEGSTVRSSPPFSPLYGTLCAARTAITTVRRIVRLATVATTNSDGATVGQRTAGEHVRTNGANEGRER